MIRPTIVCPVDFSDPSRASLRYGVALAEHFGARVVVLAVDDPLLAAAADSAGLPPLAEATAREVSRFVSDTVSLPKTSAAALDVQVRTGRPASEILRATRAASADLIVMGSHGRSGLRKKFFGSTAERVLRETTTPVLIVPSDAADIADFAGIARHVRRVLAPLDLTAVSAQQVRVAAGIATGLGVPLIAAHVLEPVYVPPALRLVVPGADGERRAAADLQLQNLTTSAAATSAVEALVLGGDPSEEIVRLADTRGGGLIVIGLHSSGLIGPRMGSVTYRVLCQTRALVLALPPHTMASPSVAALASVTVG